MVLVTLSESIYVVSTLKIRKLRYANHMAGSITKITHTNRSHICAQFILATA